jgi:hypothetical protein
LRIDANAPKTFGLATRIEQRQYLRDGDHMFAGICRRPGKEAIAIAAGRNYPSSDLLLKLAGIHSVQRPFDLQRDKNMPEFHSEPFLHLAGLTHKSALIAWGAFYFRVRNSDESFKLVDDSDLKHVHPPRRETVGARSEPYGDALVEVFDKSGKVIASAATGAANHCWVAGLQPDTEYTYRVSVNGEEWGGGERRDWVAEDDALGLRRIGNSYQNRFRTHPDPTQPVPEPFTFAVIGDFGTGIKKKNRPQRSVADALDQAVDDHNVRLILTTGDNIYAGKRFLGLPVGQEGDEDDDWYFTYYQPYRYIINHVPVYPSIGNHDANESEDRDDRSQLIDNFYLNERIAGEEAAGRASFDPGLFYRFRYGAEVEFVCIDTPREPDVFKGGRLFKHPKHSEFLKLALPDISAGAAGAAVGSESPAWRIPFSHHPPFSAGPQHHNTAEMEELVDRLGKAGVRVVFSGHEHNFQHSQHDGIDYFVTGAGGKLRSGKPDRFKEAHTVSWCAASHFLLVTIDGQRMTVRPIAGLDGAELSEIQRLDRDGQEVSDPIVISLT